MKYCNKCKRIKRNNYFNKSSLTKDGLQAYCRFCMNTKYSPFLNAKPRICALPDCGKVFCPKRESTMFCCARCAEKAKYQKLDLHIVEIENSSSKLPQKAFVGAEEMECVVL